MVGGGSSAHLLTLYPSCFTCVLHPTPSNPIPSLQNPSPPCSPLIGCSFLVGFVFAGEREKRVDLTVWRSFKLRSLSNRDFDCHRSIFFRSPKIMKLIIHTLYADENISSILICV